MACSLTLAGRELPCKNNVGGVKNVWILTNYNSTGESAFVPGMYSAVTGGRIASTAVATLYNDYASPKNVTTFTQTINSSVENGNIFYTQVLSLTVSKEVAADVIELREMKKGRLAIIVEDYNGVKYVMGHTRGAEVSGGTVTTGTAVGDLNGITIEFTAEEQIPCPQVGAGTNMTFTPTV